MKVKLEIELEVVHSGNHTKHNITDEILLLGVKEKIGTNINNMYIDQMKIIKTEII